MKTPKKRDGIISRSYVIRNDVASLRVKKAFRLACLLAITATCLLILNMGIPRIPMSAQSLGADSSRKSSGEALFSSRFNIASANYSISVDGDYSFRVRETNTFAFSKGEIDALRSAGGDTVTRILRTSVNYPCASIATTQEVKYNDIERRTTFVDQAISKTIEVPRILPTKGGFFVRQRLGDRMHTIEGGSEVYETEIKYRVASPLIEQSTILPLLVAPHDPINQFSFEIIGAKDNAWYLCTKTQGVAKEIPLSLSTTDFNEIGRAATSQDSEVFLKLVLRTSQ